MITRPFGDFRSDSSRHKVPRDIVNRLEASCYLFLVEHQGVTAFEETKRAAKSSRLIHWGVSFALGFVYKVKIDKQPVQHFLRYILHRCHGKPFRNEGCMRRLHG